MGAQSFDDIIEWGRLRIEGKVVILFRKKENLNLGKGGKNYQKRHSEFK